MIAASEVMAGVIRTIERVATVDVSVLILGESGTGKELVARAIHDQSHRAAKPFVAVNCAAIPENLLESELFGYEKGAFTGAVKQTIGKVEQARGGTLFLDEIGDMPLALQAKMLRFLQSRSIQRLGGQDEVAVDVRFVSASNRNIEQMAREGTFREDLFFRINEVAITVPALRDREGDVILIATTLLRRYAETYRRGPFEFAADAVAAISGYAWPGNVRELENRLKRAVVLAAGPVITAQDLGLAGGEAGDGLMTLKKARQKAEIDAIKRALAASDNNQTQAAKILGVSRPTLYNLLTVYGIKVDGD
jgi:two-component system NtrC family response regulator